MWVVIVVNVWVCIVIMSFVYVVVGGVDNKRDIDMFYFYLSYLVNVIFVVFLEDSICIIVLYFELVRIKVGMFDWVGELMCYLYFLMMVMMLV